MEVPTKETMTMMLSYLAVNFATVWFIARFAFITGIGVASFLYVGGIAIVANFIQYLTWQRMDTKK